MPIWRKEHETARVITHFSGMIIAAIAICCICGKISGNPMFEMPTATAFCLILTGLSIYLGSRGEASPADGR